VETNSPRHQRKSSGGNKKGLQHRKSTVTNLSNCSRWTEQNLPKANVRSFNLPKRLTLPPAIMRLGKKGSTIAGEEREGKPMAPQLKTGDGGVVWKVLGAVYREAENSKGCPKRSSKINMQKTVKKGGPRHIINGGEVLVTAPTQKKNKILNSKLRQGSNPGENPKSCKTQDQGRLGL